MTTETALRPSQVFCQRVREARESRRWRQADLVARLEELGFVGWRQSKITKIEQGEAKRLSVDDAFALAAALDVAPVHLFLPIEDEGTVALAPKLEVDVAKAVRWARGRQPLDPANIRFYSYQHLGDIGVINPEASPEEKAAALAEYEERTGVRVVREPARKGKP